MFITTETGLKEKINLLIKEACVYGLDSRETIPIEARMIISVANAERRGLNLNEIQLVCTICKSSEEAIAKLIRNSPEMIAKARASLLRTQPELIVPGGDLFPETRAAVCWRDCDEFMRVITYGVACNCTEITYKPGIGALLELYALLGIPVKALLYVLIELRFLSVSELRRSGFDRESNCTDGAFNDLICALMPTSQ